MNERKKALKEAYKNRKVAGCVYIVRNAGNGRYYLNYSDVSDAPGNSFRLSAASGDPYKPCMAEDWRRYGAGAFTLEVLEELEKGESQSRREFDEDLKTLLALWEEKFDPALRY